MLGVVNPHYIAFRDGVLSEFARFRQLLKHAEVRSQPLAGRFGVIKRLVSTSIWARRTGMR
jgi:hypothetical protein